MATEKIRSRHYEPRDGEFIIFTILADSRDALYFWHIVAQVSAFSLSVFCFLFSVPCSLFFPGHLLLPS